MPKAMLSRNPNHSDPEPLKWGILATGRIAKMFVEDLHASGAGRCCASAWDSPAANALMLAAFCSSSLRNALNFMFASREVYLPQRGCQSGSLSSVSWRTSEPSARMIKMLAMLSLRSELKTIQRPSGE